MKTSESQTAINQSSVDRATKAGAEKERPCFRGFFMRQIFGKREALHLLKRICVIDGQGGGIGAVLVRYLKEAFGERVELIALGTNSIAVSNMLKAGANKGASGENAVCRMVTQVQFIVGPIAVT